MNEEIRQRLALGREHYNKREFTKAESMLRQAVSMGARYADVYNMLGVIRHDRGELEGARTAFQQAVELNPNYTEAALNLIVTYNDMGRYEDARAIYQKLTAREERAPGGIDPYVRGKIANLHADLATAYQEAGLAAEGMHELRKAVLLCPDFSDLRLRLARLHMEHRDFRAARMELEEAIRHRPKYAAAHVALGLVHFEEGHTADAVAEWERALECDENDPTARMYLRMTNLSAE
jgi:Flp pilus assembly protein TadD